MMWLKNKIIDWALKQVISDHATGMTEEEKYSILAKMQDVPGVSRLFTALISADMARYYSLPENNNELQSRNKGSIIRLQWLKREMDKAGDKLQLLTKKEVYDKTQKPIG